jgi:hypothetical protein
MQGGVKGKRRNGKRKRIMQKHVKIKAENCFLKKKKKKKGRRRKNMPQPGSLSYKSHAFLRKTI